MFSKRKRTRAATEHSEVVARIVLRRELEAQQQELVKEGGELQQQSYRLQNEKPKLLSALSGYKSDPKYYAPKLAATEADLDALDEEAARVGANVDRLTARQEALAKEQASLDLTVSLAVVLEHQAQLAAVSKEAEKVRGLMEKHQGEIGEASALADPLQPIYQEREALAAAVALGERQAPELAELDKRIAAEEQAAQSDMEHREAAVDHGNQVVAGLNARLENAVAEQGRLEQFSREILRRYLVSRGEAYVSEFEGLAEAAAEALHRVMAVEHVLSGIGGSGLSVAGTGDAARSDQDAITAAVEEETRQLSKAGIQGL